MTCCTHSPGSKGHRAIGSFDVTRPASSWLLLVVPLAGYAFAWSGHAWVERNRPMTLRDPWRSLCCDYWMTWLVLTGRAPAVETHVTGATGAAEG